MRVIVVAIVVSVLCTAASAQQQNSGARIASQIGSLVIQNAGLADQVEAMHTKTESLQARIKELEDKYEPKAKPDEKKE